VLHLYDVFPKDEPGVEEGPYGCRLALEVFRCELFDLVGMREGNFDLITSTKTGLGETFLIPSVKLGL